MKVEMIAVDRLIPYARNPRRNDGAVDAIAASIKEFGFRQPIVVDDEMVILVGHTRHKAAQKLGLDKVPVHIANGLTDTQKKAYRIADNRTNEIAEWDNDLLALELEDLRMEDFDLGVLAFDDAELDSVLASLDSATEGLTDDDEVPETPVDPVTKLGDVWVLGNHRIMCGDSTLINDVEKLMDGIKAGMVFTDPPYGVSYADKNKALNAIGRGNRIQREIKNDHMTVDEIAALFLSAFLNSHIASNDNACYYFTGPQGGELMMMMMMIEKAGWQLKHMLIWVKNNHVLGRMDYHYQHEPILYGWKQGNTHNFYGDHSQTSTWHINKPNKSELHPTMKPVELVEKAIKNSSKNNDIILDLFGGSGTTLIAAEKCNRQARLMELDPIYCDVAVKRWQDYTGKVATLEATGEPFPKVQAESSDPCPA